MKKIKTKAGNTYVSTRPNFPNDFDDAMKDEVLDRLSRAFMKFESLQRQGIAMSHHQIGVVMVSVIGLFCTEMEAAYVPLSKMTGPMAPLAELIEPGDFDQNKEVAVCLFYDHRLQQPFHPNSSVGLFILGRADG